MTHEGEEEERPAYYEPAPPAPPPVSKEDLQRQADMMRRLREVIDRDRGAVAPSNGKAA